MILFECLTGQRPFQGQTPLEILRAVQDDPTPRPSSLRPDFPRDLEIICLKCLKKEPTRRYATARELANDLDCWLRHEPISARPPTPWERAVSHIRRHPVRAAVTGVVLFAVLLTGGFFYGSYRTYFWIMAKIADEHLLVPQTRTASSVCISVRKPRRAARTIFGKCRSLTSAGPGKAVTLALSSAA